MAFEEGLQWNEWTAQVAEGRRYQEESIAWAKALICTFGCQMENDEDSVAEAPGAKGRVVVSQVRRQKGKEDGQITQKFLGHYQNIGFAVRQTVIRGL